MAPKSAKAAAAPKKEKKAKSDGPKRPTSAYFFYMNANRETIKAENPGVPVTEIAKLAGATWKKLGAGEKAKYEAMAAKDKARYEAEKSKA